MLLAIGPLTGFTGLLQILLWIVVGFLLVAFVITVFMHYRTKKRTPETDTLARLVAANPESSGYKIDDKEYVFFDHSGLIREYKTKLVNNHARYTALKQDFEKLEDKYNSLLLTQGGVAPSLNNMNMEQANLPGAAALIWENEKNEWLKKEQELHLRLQRLEMENNILQEKLAVSTAGDEERLKLVDEWKGENLQLKNKLAEKEFLQDLVEEKKMQIAFLQQQLEQRVLNFRQSEQQLEETREQLHKTRQRLHAADAEDNSLKNELALKLEEIVNLQLTLSDKESLREQQEQVLREKTEHVIYLESSIREIKEQNELLQASVADNNEKMKSLVQQLEDEQHRSAGLEQKMLANKQLMQRLYDEFSACMNAETGDSPVINLRPSYIHSPADMAWDETVIQSHS